MKIKVSAHSCSWNTSIFMVDYFLAFSNRILCVVLKATKQLEENRQECQTKAFKVLQHFCRVLIQMYVQ